MLIFYPGKLRLPNQKQKVQNPHTEPITHWRLKSANVLAFDVDRGCRSFGAITDQKPIKSNNEVSWDDFVSIGVGAYNTALILPVAFMALCCQTKQHEIEAEHIHYIILILVYLFVIL